MAHLSRDQILCKKVLVGVSDHLYEIFGPFTGHFDRGWYLPRGGQCAHVNLVLQGGIPILRIPLHQPSYTFL